MSSTASPPGTPGVPGVAPLAVFDLDGTLADTAPDIAAALAPFLIAAGFAPLSLAEARRLLGDGMRSFARRAFALRGGTVDEAVIDAFIARYTADPVTATRLYPYAEGAIEALHQAGWRLAVCTNKTQAAAERVLERLGVADYFVAICGGDSVPAHKPDAGHLHATVQRADATGAQVVMIGDNLADVQVAAACGVPSIFAAWGYSERQAGEDADAVADEIAAVPALLARWVGAAHRA